MITEDQVKKAKEYMKSLNTFDNGTLHLTGTYEAIKEIFMAYRMTEEEAIKSIDEGLSMGIITIL